MNNDIVKTALAIKKLREIKGLNRKAASVLLEIGHKSIERIENCRAPLNEERIVKYVSRYGFTMDDFNLCLNGHVTQVRDKYSPEKPKVIENNILRRSYKRIVTKEVKTLQVLRRLKRLTQHKASVYCGYHRSAIGHIENGRIELTPKKVKHIVESFGYTMADFEYHFKSDQFITDIQENCINIIRALSEEKLKAVYPLLQTFNK